MAIKGQAIHFDLSNNMPQRKFQKNDAFAQIIYFSI